MSSQPSVVRGLLRAQGIMCLCALLQCRLFSSKIIAIIKAMRRCLPSAPWAVDQQAGRGQLPANLSCPALSSPLLFLQCSASTWAATCSW